MRISAPPTEQNPDTPPAEAKRAIRGKPCFQLGTPKNLSIAPHADKARPENSEPLLEGFGEPRERV